MCLRKRVYKWFLYVKVSSQSPSHYELRERRKREMKRKTNHRRKWNNISKHKARLCWSLSTTTTERRKRKDIKLNYRRKWKPFMDNISLQFSGEMCAHVISYKSITFTFWLLGILWWRVIGYGMECWVVKRLVTEEGRQWRNDDLDRKVCCFLKINFGFCEIHTWPSS